MSGEADIYRYCRKVLHASGVDVEVDCKDRIEVCPFEYTHCTGCVRLLYAILGICWSSYSRRGAYSSFPQIWSVVSPDPKTFRQKCAPWQLSGYFIAIMTYYRAQLVYPVRQLSS